MAVIVPVTKRVGLGRALTWEEEDANVQGLSDGINTVSLAVDALSSGGVGASMVVLSATAQTFKFNAAGAASPTGQTITFAAQLVNLAGSPTFAATGYDSSGASLGTLPLGGSGATRTLTVANFAAAAYAVVSATSGAYSDQITVVRISDGAAGANAVVGMLTNEAVAVSADSGGTVSDFSGAVGTFKVFNGTTDVTGAGPVYSVASSTNVTATINASSGAYAITAMSAASGFAALQAVYGGVTLTKIFNISKSQAGTAGAAGAAGAPGATGATGPAGPTGSTGPAGSTGPTGSTGPAGPAGAAGAAGANGTQSANPTVYQWAATLPSGPTGAATYTWASSDFGSAPSGWTLTPGTSPSVGFTLWGATVLVVDSAANTTTGFNWGSAIITARGYAGTNGAAGATGATGATGPAGTNGTNGTAGASTRIAYALVTGFSLNSTPTTLTTSGSSSFPPTNSWGGSESWSATVPSVSAGQSVFQTNGIYDPGTGNTVWGVPYQASLKVGTLSAITANTGALSVTGNLTMSSTSAILGGVSAYGDPGGFFLGYSGGTYKISFGGLTFDGTTLTVPAIAISGTIPAAQVAFGGLSVSIGGGSISQSVAAGASFGPATIGSRTASATGGTGAITYSWAISTTRPNAANIWIQSGINAATVVLYATCASGGDTQATLTVTARDANGLTATASFNANIVSLS